MIKVGFPQWLFDINAPSIVEKSNFDRIDLSGTPCSKIPYFLKSKQCLISSFDIFLRVYFPEGLLSREACFNLDELFGRLTLI